MKKLWLLVILAGLTFVYAQKPYVIAGLAYVMGEVGYDKPCGFDWGSSFNAHSTTDLYNPEEMCFLIDESPIFVETTISDYLSKVTKKHFGRGNWWLDDDVRSILITNQGVTADIFLYPFGSGTFMVMLYK